MLRARLHGAGAERDAWIVDLSSRGLAATTDRPPRQGDQVELVVGDFVLTGQVKWVSMRRFGMQFRERISVNGLLSDEDEAPKPQAIKVEVEPQSGGVSRLFTKAESAMLFGGGAFAALVVFQFVTRSL
jgi:hypothetical protein